MGDDEGGASVFGALVALALVVVTALTVHVGAVVVARHRAQAAADLAALAVAGALDRGIDDACGRGRGVAEGMGSVVSGCEVVGWFATVWVSVPVAVPFPGADAASAVARAGPAEG